MAVNQAKIFEQLEQLTSEIDRDEFIYGFMSAFDFPKATITQVRQGGARNVAKEAGHVALKNKLYFQPVVEGSDLNALLETRLSEPGIAQNKIRFVLVTDFIRFLAWDTLSKELLDIELDELHSNYGFFLPLVGLEKAIVSSENPADVKAAEKMGKLFDLIRIQNDLSQPADIHALNVFLTRLLFCLFAEDTGIFAKGQFTSAIQSYTEEDGRDLDFFLDQLFTVLNSEPGSAKRQNLPVHLTVFPYVNGGLFSSDQPIPELGKKGRRILLECGTMDWSEINPDIFGSMFQAVIDVAQRSRLGQHYTSYSNIMKVSQPLFLDSLQAELDKQLQVAANKRAKGLQALLVRMGQLKVFDPACGSGNFLIVAYKELRKLEMAVIKALEEVDPQGFAMSGLHLSQFYGIEIDDFACEIARLSLWLAEHQFNNQWQQAFGYAPSALPLRESGNIYCGNSLDLDWDIICPKSKTDEVYVIGNPPFHGHVGRSDRQRKDMEAVFAGFGPLGYLDYVACWFWKGAKYINGTQAELTFVSTNSICQGEQAATLWPSIFSLSIKIHIAYQTFQWANNAKDKAAVHVVIIGLSGKDNKKESLLFQNIDGVWHEKTALNISPYLLEGGDTVVRPIPKPMCKNVPAMKFGSLPNDGGNLFLDFQEMSELLSKNAFFHKWIRPVIGAKEFLNGQKRWCLWLVDASEDDLFNLPEISERLRVIKETRAKAGYPAALKTSKTPHLFMQISHPSEGKYIVVPKVSSFRRTYIPIGILDSNIICTDLNNIIPGGDLFEFGIISSVAHNEWAKLVAGKLKSDYRYTSTIVYNTFPWPDVTEAQRKEIERSAEEVLLTREEFSGCTLAELYDPDKMPNALLAAHQVLDSAVDRLYRDRPFKDAADRLSCLLARYEALVGN